MIALGGTLREVAPEVTLTRVSPHLERIGITRVAHLTGLDATGVPVSAAIRPQGRSLSTSLGKGITQILADVSAVMESIEVWHAENLPPPAATGAAGDVGPIVDLAPARTWIRTEAAHAPIAWLRVRELHSGEQRLAPAAGFDLDTADPARDRQAIRYRPTTTGLASGNTLDEAILHALCEIVERDAVARMAGLSHVEVMARRLDLTSVDGVARDVLDRFARAHIAVEVLDITSDLGIPAFHATIVDTDELRGPFVDRGMGAHTDPEIALVRALVEAAQSRVGYISGSRDDFWPDDFSRGELAPVGVEPGTRALSSCARIDAVDLRDAITTVLERLREPVWMLDHTRADLGIPVVHLRCPARLDAAASRS